MLKDSFLKISQVFSEEERLLPIIIVLAIILIFAYSWVPGGLDIDSCMYAVVAKDIVRTGHWLNLYDATYNGPFYYHFPLLIWITALIFKIFGVSTFTAKLFSMTSGILIVVVLFYFGKFIAGRWTGFFAAISYLMTNHIVRLARQCRMDIPVSLFITLALFMFILAQRRSRRYYLLFGLFSCLAIFTKDIFGLFPIAIVFAYLVFRLKWKELIHPFFLSGIFLAIVPVIIWIILDHQYLWLGWYRWNFLHLYKSPSFTVPWYYYLRAITTKYFYFLPFTIYGAYLTVKKAHENKNDDLYVLLIWIIIFPLAFSFGRQKLHYFILPIYPVAALLVGLAFDKIFNPAIKIRISQATSFIIIIFMIILISFPISWQSKRFIETVKLAPFIDEFLRQAKEYQFFVYQTDTASLLFYSKEALGHLSMMREKEKWEAALTAETTIPIFCYTDETAFLGLAPTLRKDYEVPLQYKDKLFIGNKAAQHFRVRLP